MEVQCNVVCSMVLCNLQILAQGKARLIVIHSQRCLGIVSWELLSDVVLHLGILAACGAHISTNESAMCSPTGHLAL